MDVSSYSNELLSVYNSHLICHSPFKTSKKERKLISFASLVCLLQRYHNFYPYTTDLVDSAISDLDGRIQLSLILIGMVYRSLSNQAAEWSSGKNAGLMR